MFDRLPVRAAILVILGALVVLTFARVAGTIDALTACLLYLAVVVVLMPDKRRGR